MNLVDKVKNLGSRIQHKGIVFIAVATTAVAVSGCGVSNEQMEGYTAQIQQEIKSSGKATEEYVNGQTAEMRKYVDREIAAAEEVRTLKQTIQNLTTARETDTRIEKSKKEITDYFVREFGKITNALGDLELAVNTAAEATTRNEEQIANYAKQIGEITGQLKALEQSVKVVSGDTVNKADYTREIKALGERVTSLERQLTRYSPPTPPPFPTYAPLPICPPTNYSARNVNDILTAGRYYFDGDLARAMFQLYAWRFQDAFPLARSEWFDGRISNGEVVRSGPAVHVDNSLEQARIYFEGGRTSTFTFQSQAVTNLMLDFFGPSSPYQSMIREVTIQTPCLFRK